MTLSWDRLELCGNTSISMTHQTKLRFSLAGDRLSSAGETAHVLTRSTLLGFSLSDLVKFIWVRHQPISIHMWGQTVKLRFMSICTSPGDRSKSTQKRQYSKQGIQILKYGCNPHKTKKVVDDLLHLSCYSTYLLTIELQHFAISPQWIPNLS